MFFPIHKIPCKNHQRWKHYHHWQPQPTNVLCKLTIAPKPVLPPTKNTPKHLSGSSISSALKTSDLAYLLHVTVLRPTKPMFIVVTKRGHFTTRPRLTSSLIRNHFTKSIATIKGHLHIQYNNLQTTK